MLHYGYRYSIHGVVHTKLTSFDHYIGGLYKMENILLDIYRNVSDRMVFTTKKRYGGSVP